ncbi:MAG: gluconokinase [Chloroflexota bacterium]
MPGLPELAQALLDPKAYPDSSSGVHPELSRGITLMQTQMSLVFLTGEYVYKVKKPVDLGYLDYTTLEKRHFFCQREVELNRRLCPDAYLGVVPITDDRGHIRIDGSGAVIEYAVKMRQLPQERMLNVLLAGNRVTGEMITGVAKKMAEFHKAAATSPAISRYGSLDIITLDAEEDFSQTVKYLGKTISQETYQHIKRYTNDFIEANADLFSKRVTDGRIRDCHGDLHAAHVCFNKNGICIYDCIEFNDRFRYLDVASEIAFLAMDLDNYGSSDLSNSFVGDYVSFSGDEDLVKLLDFYKCYRAYVRGKVEGFKLDSPLMPEDEKKKALAAAKKYFELAEGYIG